MKINCPRLSSSWQRIPWVPETFLARFPVSSPLVASAYGRCRPSVNTENARRMRGKPLVLRVAKNDSMHKMRRLNGHDYIFLFPELITETSKALPEIRPNLSGFHAFSYTWSRYAFPARISITKRNDSRAWSQVIKFPRSLVEKCVHCSHSDFPFFALIRKPVKLSNVVWTFKSVDKIVWWDCPPRQQYLHILRLPFIQYVFLTFESLDKVKWCYHSIGNFSAGLSQDNICFSVSYTMKFVFFFFQFWLKVLLELKRNSKEYLPFSLFTSFIQHPSISKGSLSSLFRFRLICKQVKEKTQTSNELVTKANLF